MPFFHGNPTKIEGGGPSKLIPEGWHLAQITAAREDVSKAGKPMSVVDYIFIDGPADSMAIRDYVSGSEAAAWRKKWMLCELGFKEMLEDTEVVIEVQDLVGKTVGLDIKHEASKDINPNTNLPYINARINGFCKPEDLKTNQTKAPKVAAPALDMSSVPF